MEKMTKGTFKVGHYQNGEMYIYKAEDESTKNHKENDKTLVTGHMPADPVNIDNCPVRNFMKYINKLNPKSDRLWQHPKEGFSETDDIWYQNRPVGRNVLSEFMQRLSKSVPLSAMYTNHSIRVTGATILGKGHSAPQIMAVTGHKTSSSLAIYQRVSDEEKRSMGDTIRNTINGEEMLALPAPPTLLPLEAPPGQFGTNQRQLMPVAPVPDRVEPRHMSYIANPGPSTGTHQRQLMPVAPVPDRVEPRHLPYLANPGPSTANQEDSDLPSDIIEMLFDNFDSLPSSGQVNARATSNTTAMTQNHAPSFNNCVFHGLTINFNMK